MGGIFVTLYVGNIVKGLKLKENDVWHVKFCSVFSISVICTEYGSFFGGIYVFIKAFFKMR